MRHDGDVEASQGASGDRFLGPKEMNFFVSLHPGVKAAATRARFIRSFSCPRRLIPSAPMWVLIVDLPGRSVLVLRWLKPTQTGLVRLKASPGAVDLAQFANAMQSVSPNDERERVLPFTAIAAGLRLVARTVHLRIERWRLHER